MQQKPDTMKKHQLLSPLQSVPADKFSTPRLFLAACLLGMIATTPAQAVTFIIGPASGGTQTSISSTGGTIDLGAPVQGPDDVTNPQALQLFIPSAGGTLSQIASIDTQNGDDFYAWTVGTPSSGDWATTFSSTGLVDASVSGLPLGSTDSGFVMQFNHETFALLLTGNDGFPPPATWTIGAFNATASTVPFTGTFGPSGSFVTYETNGPGSTTITFQIVPEPREYALIALCAVAASICYRRRTARLVTEN